MSALAYLVIVFGSCLVGGFVLTTVLLRGSLVPWWVHWPRLPKRSVARPDYRLIWDLEEDLGFEHLDGGRRPQRPWMTERSQDPVLRAVVEWAEVQERITADNDQLKRKMRLEKETLSEIDRVLRTSGEKGFL